MTSVHNGRPSATLHNLRFGHGGACRPSFFPFLTYRALRTLATSPSHRIVFSASIRAAALSVDFNWPDTVKKGGGGLPYWYQPSKEFGKFAYHDYSEDEEEFEIDSGQQMAASTVDNVDEWKWKLTMLLRNKDELEIVSKDKKDRRDFEQLVAMATRMGLHSHQYAKVIVFSEVPLRPYLIIAQIWTTSVHKGRSPRFGSISSDNCPMKTRFRYGSGGFP